jgi:glyoxylase-like metal-dependent hydrolase (beta-lactamase superfamily II)
MRGGRQAAMLMVLALGCPLALHGTEAPPFDTNPKFRPDGIQRVSEHVYVVPGFPNIGIVIGERGSLVIDTGLGPANGALVAAQAAKLAHAPKLFLVTTHFHPEHASGDAGFPKGTVLIRSRRQQRELLDDQGRTLALFERNPDFAPYLSGVSFRQPQVLFDREYLLDLGGVHARVLWLGPAHTQGDQEIFIEEDSALFSGDLAMKGIPPRGFATGSSWQTWIDILDQLSALRPAYVLPDHGEWGDASLIDAQKAYLRSLLDSGAPQK